MSRVYTEEQQQVDKELSDIVAALSHPLRLRIVYELTKSDKPRNVKSFVEQLQVSQPAISQHLAKLATSGVLKRSKDGTKVYYEIEDDNIKSIVKAIYGDAY